jgi:hypothetical protein
MVLQMVSNVSQVQEKCEKAMFALMEHVPSMLIYSNEKFCTILNLPGLCSLGMIDREEVWKRPIWSSIYCYKKGPLYLIVLNLQSMIC